MTNHSYLLVVEFLGLPRLEELQQVPQRSLIVVSDRISWTVPVPGHHTTRQGGRMKKGRKEARQQKRINRGEKRGKWTRREKEVTQHLY